ncbi:SGNH/GDSL hydrolase family protein [Streptomyces sp. OF3]|uniref:SGNH/GDSL hydrolase family protein n=1 Tax=Streptomyces alkaliterrae TaxID=2213162 RepID=A0A7W3WKJ0_9ACTN|nr:SGNH/GDSL hydrolase family protein [Streptomyces alkaliterrae]MBB1254014.1 SGNH/GDSL hydrolase family protein [Streptomyces alkaliterrae]
MPDAERRPQPLYHRYVALGDSQTEGVGDGDDAGGLRGFADRLAEHLARHNPGLRYANLAVRGRLAGQVHEEQLGPALALRPDLATVVAGVNDVLRPGCDVGAVAGRLELMFAALTDQGARVATLTFPDPARLTPLARPLSSRVRALNDLVRAAAARRDVLVVEAAAHAVVADPRMWSTDRLHASPLGHERIAAALAQGLTLPGSDGSWALPLPPPEVPAPSGLGLAAAELRWAVGFLGPWLVRRLRGRSSGDGRTAKRPELRPVAAGSGG